MRRSHLLCLGTVAVFALALGLRVRSHVIRSRDLSAIQAASPSTRPSWLPMPRDYVVRPWVAADEAGAGPRRIVSLAPSVTETVCALGLGDRLVGRTQYCTHPPEIASVPVVGAMLDTNFEMVRSLGPDLVLTTMNSGPVLDRLRELSLPHASVAHESIGEVFSAIERLGELCERPKTAGALSAAIRADLDRLAQAARAARGRPMEVLVCLGPLPVPPQAVWVAGPGSFLDELVRRAGHRNAAAGVMTGTHGELPLERLAALDVDVILTFGAGPAAGAEAELYASWSQFGSLEAIRRRRVHCVGGQEWLSAGPRIAIALHQVLTALSECR